MEGRLWKATWKRSGRSFSVALVHHPKIKATGSTLEEEIEKFEDKIDDNLGDAVPHLEFINALPSVRAFLFTLAGHNQIEGIVNLEELFNRPRCAKCDNICGQRTKVPIRLKNPPDDDLRFTEFLGQIISLRLATFLKLHGSKEIRLLPTVIAGRESNDFLELVSVL